MPVTLGPNESGEEPPRIEIIPLIDIMFFLLAAFMLVSLSMTYLESVPVQLPAAASAESDTGMVTVHLVVDRNGMLWWEGRVYGPAELAAALAERLKGQREPRVVVSGDGEARHADVVRALDVVRSLGIHQVTLHTRPAGQG
jgi:biopolymer transport protein ExbD